MEFEITKGRADGQQNGTTDKLNRYCDVIYVSYNLETHTGFHAEREGNAFN